MRVSLQYDRKFFNVQCEDITLKRLDKDPGYFDRDPGQDMSKRNATNVLLEQD